MLLIRAGIELNLEKAFGVACACGSYVYMVRMDVGLIDRWLG